MNESQDAEYYDTEGGEIPPDTYQPPPALPAVRPEQPNRLPARAEPEQRVTAAQSKVEAIANLTMHAYEKASLLNPSKEEQERLAAPFPDDAFRAGAGGKQALIYIEHAHLRGRLNEVFGPGNWVIIPRSRWAEDFKFYKQDGTVVPATRVYVEAMLVVRGCFAGEAIGSMDYFPNSQSADYSDAVEGAKSAALRRCCKELGIGLQAWDKGWCEGWWQRKRAQGQQKPQQQTQQATQQQKPNGNQSASKVVPPIIPEPMHPAVAKWLEDIKQLTNEDDFRRFHKALAGEPDKFVQSEVWQHLCRKGHTLGIVFDRDKSLFFQRSEPQPA